MKEKKGRKRKEDTGWDLHPWGAAEGEERLPHPGKTLHWWQDQLK